MKLDVSGSDSKSVLGLVKNIFVHLGTCTKCVCVCGWYDKYRRYHGVARPRVADGGTASCMNGSCKYMEKVVADSRQGLVLQLGCWARC
jgi:hypothetical protein